MGENKLTIPVAIILAGVIIAGAVIFTRGTPERADNTATETPKAELTIKPITDSDHILGNPGADAVIVEFSDTECPFCKSFHGTMQQIMNDYGKEGKVAWVYRHFPLEQLHKKAKREAEATECAAELGGNDAFWAYVNRIYEVTPSNDGLADSELPEIAEFAGLNRAQFESCLASGRYKNKVEEHYQDAVTAGGRGTPYSVIVLKKPLPSLAKSSLEEIALPYNASSPGTIVISEDGTRIGISGALPYVGAMKAILDVILL